MDRKLAAILAADVVGYSALMERDEAGTHRRLKDGRKELFEPEIARHHGRIFKLMGDGLLAEFGSVVDAVECAVALQRGLAERNADVPEEQRIRVRIGINLGEVIVEGKDRFGDGVNIAARLEQLAEPGGIWVSGKVAKEVEKKLAFGFEPMGEQKVKNISEPIQAFRVKLDSLPAASAPPALGRRALPWLAALVGVAALALAWFFATKPAEGPRPAATIASIAVLPFDSLGGDPNLSYFGDGVAEDIITMLSRFPDLSVVARNSSFTYKGKATDIRQVGKDLGVDYVLEGSVRREGEEVRITAQLINANDGKHAWAERFDKSGKDPLALQDEVTNKIVGTLTGELGQIKQAQYRGAWGKDTVNLGEYDYYLRGHDWLMKAETREDNERAGRIWEEGLAKYPSSALLKVKLGWYHWTAGYAWWSDDLPAEYRKAGQLVREVLARDNLTPQVSRLAHWLFAFVLMQEGDFKRAVGEADMAMAMGPYDAFVMSQLTDILIYAGEYDKALDWLAKAESRDPGRQSRYLRQRAHIARLRGNYEEFGGALSVRRGIRGAFSGSASAAGDRLRTARPLG